MGAGAYPRTLRPAERRSILNHKPRPAGLGRPSRGALSGLARASVSEICAGHNDRRHKSTEIREEHELDTPCQPLRASAVFPALSSFLHGHLNVVHAVITVYPWPFYFMMAFAPRAAITKRLLTGAKCLIPLAVLYGILLLASWTPETLSTLLPGDFTEGMKSALQGKPKMQFLPDIEAVGKLLSAPIASVSAWAHLQFIAFFCARWIWLDGLMRGVNTVHSVLLCAVVPPLGFLAHIITTFLKRQFASDSNSSAASDDSTPAPGASPPDSNTAAPSANEDSWATATAGVGIASSHGQAGGSNGSGRQDIAAGTGTVAFTAAADSAVSGRPGGRSRDDVASGNGAAPVPAEAAKPATPSADEEDMTWLTILEPVYIQRG